VPDEEHLRAMFKDSISGESRPRSRWYRFWLRVFTGIRVILEAIFRKRLKK